MPAMLLASVFVSLFDAFHFSVNRSKETNKVGVSEILKLKKITTATNCGSGDTIRHVFADMYLPKDKNISNNSHRVYLEANTEVLKSQS